MLSLRGWWTLGLRTSGAGSSGVGAGRFRIFLRGFGLTDRAPIGDALLPTGDGSPDRGSAAVARLFLSAVDPEVRVHSLREVGS